METPAPLEFRTPKIDLAAWLICRQLLKYLRTEPGQRPHQKFFVFADPERMGQLYEFDFLSGDPTANVRKFVDAKIMLRNFVDAMPGGTSHACAR